jgi:16S rRNA (uracil1498-N3)-methyltransferase
VPVPAVSMHSGRRTLAAFGACAPVRFTNGTCGGAPKRPRRGGTLTPSAAAYRRGKAAAHQGVFVPDSPAFHPGVTVSLPAEERQHLRARRIRAPASIRIFDGRGGTAMAELCDGGDAAVVCGVVEASDAGGLELDACLCLPKNAGRADWAVEKLTELGVTGVLLLETERGGDGVSESKVARLGRVCVAAVKQSMGNVVPRVQILGGIDELAASVGQYGLGLLLSPDGEPILGVLAAVPGGAASALIVAGPEGGFTREEEAALVEAGCVRASLGRRRLRVETAIVAAATAVGFFADAARWESAPSAGEQKRSLERGEQLEKVASPRQHLP